MIFFKIMTLVCFVCVSFNHDVCVCVVGLFILMMCVCVFCVCSY